MQLIANGLKTNFFVASISLVGILEDHQRKFMQDFKQSKVYQLTNMINEENWQHTKVSMKD